MTNEERFNWLANLKCNSFTLGRDESHSMNYTTAKEWIEDFIGDEEFSDVDPDELQRMKDKNTIWKLQIYPNSPTGFYLFYGATMESVIDQAMPCKLV